MTLLLSSSSLNNFGEISPEISLFRSVILPLTGWRHLVKKDSNGLYLEIDKPHCCWNDFERYQHLSLCNKIYVDPIREDHVECILEEEGRNNEKYRLVFSTYRSIPVWSIEEHDASTESFGGPIEPLFSERAHEEAVRARLEKV